MRWFVALVLIAPTAQAGVPFEIDLVDATGDVIARGDGQNVSYPSADIVSFSSRVVGDRVEQRITMAAPPTAPEDTILLRNWFHNSSNGSFWTIDMEVRGFEADPAQRFHPLMRRGDFFNVTFLGDATYAVDNATWVFTFAASWAEDGSCFDPGMFSRHIVGRSEGADALFLTNERRCLTSREPAPPAPPVVPAVTIRNPTPIDDEPAEEPPGSQAPTPGALAGLAVIALALVAWGRRP